MGSDTLLFQNLRRLINVVDGLRDVGLQQYINLPRICVVGTQSAGKSSVLEAIVGMDFLPRGEGVVTRRPLELRLVHVPEGTTREGASAWAIFEAKKDKVYTNFELVRQTIDELTEEAAGCNKGIIADPIVLAIYGTQCPDLTLIDLPGITRVPLKGSDQTDDIERHTRSMALRYVRDPRTVILAVVAANADMSTSDALQLARMEDPLGVRTIGVITKIDLMDKGTHAAKMLNGDEVPLRLGYTGVRNRSQADILEHKTIQDALADEKLFFQNHPVYRTLPPSMTGTQSLIDKLTGVLFRHIRAALPDIRREIHVKLRRSQESLDELGTGVPVQPQERVQLMWAMITDYCEVFRNTIRGKFDKKIQAHFDYQDITSGAHIRTIFNELLQDNVGASITRDMTDYDIDSAIRMHEGDSLPGFPSPDTFEYLILPHLKTIQPPVFDCLDRVAQALETLSQAIAHRIFSRFPRLADQVLELSSEVLQRQKHETKLILENIVTAEIGYLFTNDGSYLSQHGSMIPIKEKASQGSLVTDGGGSVEGESNGPQRAAANAPQNVAPSGAAGNSGLAAGTLSTYTSLQNTVTNIWTGGKKTHYSSSFIREIRARLDAYFAIVLRNIRDSVPKIVGYFLVRQLQDKLQFELYNELNKADRMADLLAEPQHIMERRLALTQQIATFTKAIQVLQRDSGVAPAGVSPDFDEAYDRDLAQSQREADLRRQQQQQQQKGLGAPVGPGGQQRNDGRQQSRQPQPPSGAYHQPHPAYPHGQHQPIGSQSQTVPQQPSSAPSVGNLWGLRPGSVKASPGLANQQAEAKRSGMNALSSNLFGDRSMRTDTVSHIFSDTKPNNPLYS